MSLYIWIDSKCTFICTCQSISLDAAIDLFWGDTIVGDMIEATSYVVSGAAHRLMTMRCECGGQLSECAHFWFGGSDESHTFLGWWQQAQPHIVWLVAAGKATMLMAQASPQRYN